MSGSGGVEAHSDPWRDDFELRRGPNLFYLWIARVFGWDALLPFMIWAIPFLIRVCFPGVPQIIEMISVVLPIFAFLFRFKIGCSHIASNGCSKFVRAIQVVTLCMGIFVLVIVDALLILSVLVPNLLANGNAVRGMGVIYAVYLTCMIVAMYPGRSLEPTVLRSSHT